MGRKKKSGKKKTKAATTNFSGNKQAKAATAKPREKKLKRRQKQNG